ncbi:xaa-Arg dipeptidase [Patella vulgata]|uniref:xaa-Arg dipeptidase n=1 Tax=Patella vulgata TaxID=6465 RepID=UPI00217FB426|nr:xaa-Arg dipeptidase [Patella vulgata]
MALLKGLWFRSVLSINSRLSVTVEVITKHNRFYSGLPKPKSNVTMEPVKTEACRAIDEDSDNLNKLSQNIWNHPELCFEEHHAHKVLTDYLEKHGFSVEREHKLKTAFKAVYKGGAGPNIAVFCEYDALPGIGHACGHNLIAELGVATSIGIMAGMKASNKELGTLTVLGSPAEEGGGGKIDLINAGVLDDIDCAMMAHPSQFMLPRPIYVAMNQVVIRFKGRASHAAGFPWEGINALDAAVMCYQNISCLRQQMKPTWRVHGVITKGGEKPNIIPDLTELLYYIRAPTNPELDVLINKVDSCIKAAATATGCTVDCEYSKKPYSALVSNNTLASLYEVNGNKVGIQTETNPDILRKQGGSTDMGNVSQVVPSIHPKFNIGTTAVNHSQEFTTASGSPVAQGYTLSVAKALAMTTLDVMMNPDLLKQVKEDFKMDMQK